MKLSAEAIASFLGAILIFWYMVQTYASGANYSTNLDLYFWEIIQECHVKELLYYKN